MLHTPRPSTSASDLHVLAAPTCPAYTRPLSQMRLVDELEQLLGLAPRTLSGNPATFAKIQSLNPFFLRSCCAKQMTVTLLAMLRSAGISEEPGPHVRSTFPDLPRVRRRSLLSDGDVRKPSQKLLETFEITSADTTGMLSSDSEFDGDSLMDCDKFIALMSAAEESELDSDKFNLAGALNKLQDMHSTISSRIILSVDRISALRNQSKRDLEYLRGVCQSGELIRDKIGELKTEVLVLEKALGAIKDKLAPKASSTLKLGNRQCVYRRKETDKESNLTAENAAASEQKIQGDYETHNTLSFYINLAIVLLFFACWIG
ncbi:hypothetical protein METBISCDRAFT_24317 [Metschnikowia bicuspidata]|uniref:Uncharacterized protein n=1 Tax=Metschnikowia bicuspidata TaxID=27322 RepID=A0A4V1J2Q3_9ASCO|nr:hypothetical protein METBISCDRAFT_24317 [Metschnikowia bicuspidata]